MLQHVTFCYFSILIVTSSATTHIANPFSYEIDQCKDICSDSFFLLPLGQDSQTVCQRGCRFFNLIDIKAERSLNDTNTECHISCAESYTNSKAMGSCTIGCDTMSKKKQSDLRKFFPYLEQYVTDEQDFDSVEADILLDPLIRKQVQMGYDIQYKIPEAYIRTMPIDDNNIKIIDADGISDKSNNYFLCSPLFTVMLLVTLLVGLTWCAVKIVLRIIEIKYNTTDDELNTCLNYDKGNKCLMRICMHFNYNWYETPEVSHIIPDETKISVSHVEDGIIIKQ